MTTTRTTRTVTTRAYDEQGRLVREETETTEPDVDQPAGCHGCGSYRGWRYCWWPYQPWHRAPEPLQVTWQEPLKVTCNPDLTAATSTALPPSTTYRIDTTTGSAMPATLTRFPVDANGTAVQHTAFPISV